VIVRAFKGKISESEVETAIQILLEIDLLEKNGSGDLRKVHSDISILDHIPRPLVKHFHKMMIERSLESIYGMPENKRHLLAATMAVKESMVPIIQKRLDEFLVSLNREFSSDGGDAIYQLNLQLFNLAVKPGEAGRD